VLSLLLRSVLLSVGALSEWPQPRFFPHSPAELDSSLLRLASHPSASRFPALIEDLRT